MALEKNIIKRGAAEKSAFDYQPREIAADASKVARSFVSEDAFISSDFKISELVAQQAGISRLEDEAHQDKIQAQVLEKLKEVEERAYREGYELGQIEGGEKAFREAQAELQQRMDMLESLLRRIETLKTRIFTDNEAELIAFVFQIGKRLAMRDIEANREAVVEILRQTVGDTQSDERVLVRLNSIDLAFIESLQEKTDKRIESLERVKFVIDDAISAGGCRIETEYGNIDATLEERVERVWQTLKARIPHNRGDGEGSAGQDPSGGG